MQKQSKLYVLSQDRAGAHHTVYTLYLFKGRPGGGDPPRWTRDVRFASAKPSVLRAGRRAAGKTHTKLTYPPLIMLFFVGGGYFFLCFCCCLLLLFVVVFYCCCFGHTSGCSPWRSQTLRFASKMYTNVILRNYSPRSDSDRGE